MENKEQAYRTSLMIWYSFFVSIFLYGIPVGISMGGFSTKIEDYKMFFKMFYYNAPHFVKILFFVGLIEFIFFFTIQKGKITLLKSLNPLGKYLILWAFAEFPALLGLISAFRTGESIYFIPMFVLSLIALLFSFPKKGEFKEKKDLPYSFE
ncbi:hypothetical protein TTHT_1114 [Thermotomaculum hydrothermale]|uniref:Uncharacterized protein n=1 Tax=Thermotomaculum hydrothermale TaxID=981385 RepID=A0A7R6SYH3_9BACT|nr:hypothetical protein [Thermotomaculum hydrothermale]BBB32650.1 hypothetical protein TTHT_1114 [Thermotomaculum hydrothermale]